MAFCPNCGTPNTDQAEKCVACGFELALPKQKPKFKGTIMMSGIKAPTAPQPAPVAPPTEPESAAAPVATPTTPASASSSIPPATRNLAFEKTMLGRPVELPGRTPTPAANSESRALPPEPTSGEHRAAGPTPAATPANELSQAPTVQQPAPGFTNAADRSAATTSGPAYSSQESGASSVAHGGGSSSGAWGESARPSFSSDPGSGRSSSQSTTPPISKGPGKLVAIGCVGALAVFCVVAAYLLKAMFSGGEDSTAEAAAWQASISQSLAQVSALCQVDCERASVFFHPNTQAALLPETKALTAERVQKLSDPAQSIATMLDGTDDEKIATELGLDPQLCARVTQGKAKIVSCSVPDPSGKPGVLRIVHLSGIGSL
jgi:hypothetical protein